jgi:hypothetical protein
VSAVVEDKKPFFRSGSNSTPHFPHVAIVSFASPARPVGGGSSINKEKSSHEKFSVMCCGSAAGCADGLWPSV